MKLPSIALLLLLGIGSGMAWGQIPCTNLNCPDGPYPFMRPQVKPKPEPVDVPAIQEMVYREKVGLKQIGSKWTCADKSRILLTGEDGVRHCIKFAEAK